MSIREQAKSIIPIIQALADGKKIQYRYYLSPERGWVDYEDSIDRVFSPLYYLKYNYKWRIKPEKKTGWINIYPDGIYNSCIHPDKQTANELSSSKRIACIQITYEEGEGL